MGKTCLLTGASGEIGRAIAEELAKDGYQLILQYHQNGDAVESLKQCLPEEAVLQTIQADLTTSSGIHSMCTKLAFTVDTIVFAGGMNVFGLFQDVPESKMDELYHVHVKAPWLICQHILPSMLEQKHGHIICISSIWGEIGASCEVIYSSVKGAQDSFVKSLAKEVAPSGIRVNGIRPGFIDTKMNNHLDEESLMEIKEEIPAGRLGRPVDIANVVLFLTQESSAYIHGQMLNVNGAWSG